MSKALKPLNCKTLPSASFANAIFNRRRIVMIAAQSLALVILGLAPVYGFPQLPAIGTSPQTPTKPPVSPTIASPEKPSSPPTQAYSHPLPKNRNCLSIEEAAHTPGHDVCVSAHVYDVVQLADGTRFLDVCPSALPDDQCHFTILCPASDSEEVGSLLRFRDQQIQIRGMVHAVNGRMGIVLSHVRQFDGGPEKFRPNPMLLRGFNSQSDRLPVRDPNLARAGRHRSFMNNYDRESLPAKK